MDFLDPQKQRANVIKLIVGYVLIGIAILFATLILYYQANGFGFGKSGEVIQNGFVFMSSQPQGAGIYLDNKKYKSNTNARLQLEAGQYEVQIRKDGYRTWQRLLSVDGGSVDNYDYPLLVPNQLKTDIIKSYPAAPSFVTQSPDRRWLIVQQDASPLNFDLYDLADPKRTSAALTSFVLPETLMSSPRVGTQRLHLVEWASDNRHVLIRHEYGDLSEYITIDRSDPAQSINLTRALSLSPTQQLSLHDKKFDKFYIYDTASKSLASTTLAAAGRPVVLLDQILAFKSYGSDKLLYVTDKLAPAGKVTSVLLDGTASYKIRDLDPAGPFLLEMSEYDNDWYVVIGATPENRVYVYKDPQQVRKSLPTAALVPVQVLKVAAPNYVAFSSNSQFVTASNGTNFADYDAENTKGYRFVAKYPLDKPAIHATWMDSHHLTYVSGGKVVFLDYDNINGQTLMPANPNYLPAYDRNYKTVYTFVTTTSAEGESPTSLMGTSLLTATDQ